MGFPSGCHPLRRSGGGGCAEGREGGDTDYWRTGPDTAADPSGTDLGGVAGTQFQRDIIVRKVLSCVSF